MHDINAIAPIAAREPFAAAHDFVRHAVRLVLIDRTIAGCPQPKAGLRPPCSEAQAKILRGPTVADYTAKLPHLKGRRHCRPRINPPEKEVTSRKHHLPAKCI